MPEIMKVYTESFGRKHIYIRIPGYGPRNVQDIQEMSDEFIKDYPHLTPKDIRICISHSGDIMLAVDSESPTEDYKLWEE